MFNNLSIKVKLLTGFVVVAIIAGVVGYIGMSNISKISEADTNLYEKMTVPLGQVIDMTSLYQRMRVNIRDMVMSVTPEEQKKFESRFLELSNAFDTTVAAYEKTILTEVGQNANKKLKADKEAYIAVNMKIIQMLKSGAKLPELLVFMRSDESVLTTKNIQASLDSTQNMKIRLAGETAKENTELANSATTTMIVFVAIGVFLAILIGWMIARNIQSIIQSIIKETRRLVEAAINGKLDTRGNPEQINFEFREIVVGLNKTLDAVIGPLNVAAEYIDRISKGDMPPQITDEYKGDFNEIKMNVNQCINAVQLLITDAGILAKAAVEGKLDTRADASKHQGDFRKIVQGVNNTLDSVIGPLNVAAEYVDRISKGDIPPQITDNYNGDFNEIKMNLNQCITSVRLLVDDAAMLSKAAVEGKLDTRADASKHNGDFRKIVQGVNNTLDSVIGPLNVAAEYMDRISKGDIPAKITDNYNGDFNEIKNNINQMIDTMGLILGGVDRLVTSVINGNLNDRAHYEILNGDWRKLVKGINDIILAFVGPINVTAEYIDRISKGDMPPLIVDDYKGDFNEIKTNLNQCISAVKLMIEDAGVLSKAAVDGKLDVRADATKHNGDFRKIVQGVNETLDSVIGPLNVAAEYVDRISKGDIPPKITDEYLGDFNEIKNNLNQCIDAVASLTRDSKSLANSAVAGDLKTRAESIKHNGDFRNIINGVNETLDAITKPMNDAAHILAVMATGDLTSKMTGEYKGDYQILKTNINTVLDSLNNLITQITYAVDQVSEASFEISSTADTIAAASEEQSSQADEVANAVEAMSRTITENAMAASRTAQEANNNGRIAKEGGEVVAQTVSKMKDIANVVKKSAENIEKLGESSKQIGEIISVIDDIADQTNLLALNAAIEAARAGEQGRGFAVVADEVRKLAERTTEATKQIASMIKGIQSETEEAVIAMKRGNEEVTSGIALADRAGSALQQILVSTQDLQMMISKIASASEEQSSTSEEIAKNVNSISHVTNDSTKRIQEIAKSSEEMAKLTDNLKELVQQFKTEDSLNLQQIGSRSIKGNSARHLQARN